MGPNLQRRPYDVGKIVEENLSWLNIVALCKSCKLFQASKIIIATKRSIFKLIILATKVLFMVAISNKNQSSSLLITKTSNGDKI